MSPTHDDMERVLRVLIHDARTPIGVAQGYVRLLREERLASPEERERALTRAMEALGRIARLCDDASAFLAPPSSSSNTIGALTLASSVEGCVRAWHFLVSRGPIAADRVRIDTNGERLAEAIALVLATVRPASVESSPHLHIDNDGRDLRFVATPAGIDAAAVEEPPAGTFDAWRGGGLAVPLASHIIHDAGGRIARAETSIVVRFPTEAPTA